MIDENLKSKLLGLRNMANAESAAKGERDNARCLYERLLANHNLTDADIADEMPDYVEFPITRPFEKDLVIQIVAKITNDRNIQTYSVRNHKNQMAVKLTKRQAELVLKEYAIYRKSLKAELECCFHAFVQVNKIFSNYTRDRELTQEEEKEIEKMFRMASGIDPTPITSGLLTKGGPKKE